MALLEHVEMIHPRLPGQPYMAPKQGVAQMQRSGWQIADQETPPDPPAPEKPTEAPAESGASSLESEPPKRRRASEIKEGE